ncbi:DUF533 domain-containing protein [Aureimonas jatrophae]|uniref:Uncharacterized protein n=1 Tax=Aureimonas jatrophae TaxID=1166073 RepID=A0A1H0LM64_9HYPH|nr:DUF533 domain-containing protein [Aureimonas jatrophae]MBB3952570.1 hypothetical protein [Aureimonas jatrophae]SDO68970.1 Protein of unknown function [Aureimonas jatrophae]
MALRWIRSLFPPEAGPQDGEGLNLAVAAPGTLEAANANAHEPGAAPPPVRRDTIEAHLAVKVLAAHLANRYQTSYPLTLNLDLLSPEEGEATMRLLADAVAAEGSPSPERVAQVCEQLARLGAAEPQLAFVRAALADPGPLNPLVAAVRSVDKGPHVYALALLCGVGRGTAGAAYLAFLSLRLGLSRETVGSLSRRFRG